MGKIVKMFNLICAFIKIRDDYVTRLGECRRCSGVTIRMQIYVDWQESGELLVFIGSFDLFGNVRL